MRQYPFISYRLINFGLLVKQEENRFSMSFLCQFYMNFVSLKSFNLKKKKPNKSIQFMTSCVWSIFHVNPKHFMVTQAHL